jgi:hypothetical protein
VLVGTMSSTVMCFLWFCLICIWLSLIFHKWLCLFDYCRFCKWNIMVGGFSIFMCFFCETLAWTSLVRCHIE